MKTSCPRGCTTNDKPARPRSLLEISVVKEATGTIEPTCFCGECGGIFTICWQHVTGVISGVEGQSWVLTCSEVKDIQEGIKNVFEEISRAIEEEM